MSVDRFDSFAGRRHSAREVEVVTGFFAVALLSVGDAEDAMTLFDPRRWIRRKEGLAASYGLRRISPNQGTLSLCNCPLPSGAVEVSSVDVLYERLGPALVFPLEGVFT